VTLVVCVDDNGGMMFGGRRQSRDRVLCAKLQDMCTGRRLLVSPYSAPLFDGNVTVCDDPCVQAAKTDVCFIENTPPNPENCDEVWMFRWNRRYPADVRFPIDLAAGGFLLKHTEEFAGSSHPNITLERYQRG